MSDGRYFQTTKRGEIHELKEELHSANKDKKKEAVKKVIAAMTVGKDVSALFPDVVNCMQTTNIELKKLVYLYVINYAKAQPELAILAVNTFRKDSLDPNPLIRALAVRTMGCIRLEQITEYLVEPLKRCCKDQDPYVRKTAAICIAKLYDISPDLVEDEGFIDILKDMLSDSNPMVVANSVASLCEITETSGKQVLQLNDGVIAKLLAALNECTEWGQVFILDAIAQYQPGSAREAESVLERVTARLSHANAAVVMSAIKVVMKLLDRVTNQETVRNLQRKLSPPLVTLLSSEPEIQYVALRNINLIVQKRPTILANEVKMFFCKYNDPVYVKMEKLDIMVRLASEKNVEQVLSEFKEYATEVDVDFVRKAVRSIGRCAIKLEKAAEKCINVLLDLIETKVNYVVQEAIVVIKDIFRKYPNRYESIISALCENLDSLDEPEAKASMIWIIGEYAERIDNADELLDSFLENFHDEPASVQLQILTSTVKLFLKSPGNTQDMVTKVLKMSTVESDNPDLRDRGYIYWRLLSSNPEATKQVVLSDKPAISDDLYSLDPSVLDRLIDGISLLSSVYHKLPEAFVTRLRTAAAQRDADADSEDGGDVDKVAKAAAEMKNKKEYHSDDEGESSRKGKSEQGGNKSDSDSEGGPANLLDLDDDASPAGGAGGGASAVPSVNKPVVLAPDAAGAKGGKGLGIKAALLRHKGQLYCQLTAANMSGQEMNGWAIQFNRNPFGLAPAGPLALPNLAHGQSADTNLPVSPNQLLSGQPAAGPLSLQVAVKTNVDVFYFNLPFDLAAVLTEDAPTDKDYFRNTWQQLGEAQQQAVMCMNGNNAPLSADVVISTLKQYNTPLIAQRGAETFEVLYFTSKTSAGNVIFSEISLQKTAGGVKIAVRGDTPSVAPLFQQMCVRLFNLAAR